MMPDAEEEKQQPIKSGPDPDPYKPDIEALGDFND